MWLLTLGWWVQFLCWAYSLLKKKLKKEKKRQSVYWAACHPFLHPFPIQGILPANQGRRDFWIPLWTIHQGGLGISESSWNTSFCSSFLIPEFEQQNKCLQLRSLWTGAGAREEAASSTPFSAAWDPCWRILSVETISEIGMTADRWGVMACPPSGCQPSVPLSGERHVKGIPQAEGRRKTNQWLSHFLDLLSFVCYQKQGIYCSRILPSKFTSLEMWEDSV